MTTYVALLYSVTLGPGRRLVMADFRALAATLGYSNPRTVLATGNLVFEAHEQSLPKLTRTLERAFADTFQRHIDVIVCTATQWQQLLTDNPFPGPSVADPSHVVVRVMRDPLADDVLLRLEPLRENGEIMHAVNGHFWCYFANGIGQSKLAAAMTPKRMGGAGTSRNWNTVQKITQLLDT